MWNYVLFFKEKYIFFYDFYCFCFNFLIFIFESKCIKRNIGFSAADSCEKLLILMGRFHFKIKAFESDDEAVDFHLYGYFVAFL